MKRYVSPIFIILLLVLVLTGLGLVMIASTTAPLADGSTQLKRQLIWFSAGILAFGVMGWLDYRILRPWVWVFFGMALVLSSLVFVPGIGSRVNGANRWLNLFGFKIQPSEFLRSNIYRYVVDVTGATSACSCLFKSRRT